MLRGGTSRGLYFEPGDLPADPAERDDLLLRLMGTPDPRQIDGLGGATSLTSKVAVVGRSDAPRRRRRLPVPAARGRRAPRSATSRTAATSWPGSARSPSSAGWSRAGDGETSVRIRMVNSDSIAVATFPTPDGRVEYRGDVAIAGVPGDRRARSCSRSPTPRVGDRQPAADRAACGTRSTAIEVTCVDNGMPVVSRWPRRSGSPATRPHERARRRRRPARPDRRLPAQGRPADGPGRRVRRRRCRRRRCSPRPATAARSCTRSFIPVQPHTAIGVLGRGQRRHRHAAARRGRPRAHRGLAGRHRSQIDVEHPTGHLLVDVIVDARRHPATRRPLGRRPHRPQALRRHRLSPH